jgi:hypothetical protein
MDRLGGKGGYLPLILPLASAVGFCLSRYRRWDTRFYRLCILCRCSLLYSVFFLALGMSISFVARSRHLKSVPALPRTMGSSITSYPSAASNLHSSACCSFFSMTLSMYLVSEEYPNSISHIFLGLPFIWVGTLLSPFLQSPVTIHSKYVAFGMEGWQNFDL